MAFSVHSQKKRYKSCHF